MSRYGTWPQRELFVYTTYRDAYNPPLSTVSIQNYSMPNKVRLGSAVPNYRYKIENGLSATSAFTGQKHQWVYRKKGSAILVQQQSPPLEPRALTWSASGWLAIPPYYTSPVFLTDPTKADNAAKAKLYKAIKAQQVKMTGGVFLGELAQTVRLIKNPALALREGLGDYLTTLHKRKRGRHTKSSLRKTAADTWLEYVFGWTPLINDVEDAYKAYRHLIDKISSERVQVRAEEEKIYYQSIFGSSHAEKLYFLSHLLVTQKIESIWTAGLKAVAQGGAAQNPSAITTFGLNAREFIPTAWELIPWSFVVDYFTNVGDIISAACTDTSSVTWLSRTIRKTFTQKVTCGFDSKRTKDLATGAYVKPTDCDGDGGRYQLDIVNVGRSVPVLSLPSFMVRWPGGGSTKWINLAALAASHKKLTPYFS